VTRWRVECVRDDSEALERLLADGWEPFAAVATGGYVYYCLRIAQP